MQVGGLLNQLQRYLLCRKHMHSQGDHRINSKASLGRLLGIHLLHAWLGMPSLQRKMRLAVPNRNRLEDMNKVPSVPRR